MKHTLIILLLMSASLSAQTVKFTQIEPSTTKFTLPVAEKQIPGQAGKYFLKYMTLAELQDSVGCCTDSIFMIGDTITLRDGSGYVVPGATYYITSANGQKKGDFLKPFYINENLAKNQIWNGNTWIDFDKDVFSTNELGTYFDGTITTPIQPKKGDLWFNTGISVPQLQIFTGTSWVQVEYFDQTNYTSLATDAPNNTIFIIQPNTGATPTTITTEAKGPITLDYATIDANNWKQTIGIDTMALVNIILDSIPPPTPSVDSTSVLSGYGITVTETPSNTFTIKADTSVLATNYDLTLKQDNLISGTNIKTVNGNSLLGSGNVVINSGVTSVTASSPLSSSGGTSPNITIQNANGSTTGALTSTDWNTFNQKLGSNTPFGPDVTGTYNNLRGKYMQYNTDLGADANVFSSGKFTYRYVNIGVPTSNIYSLLEVPFPGSTSNWQLGSRITDNLLRFRNNNAGVGIWQELFSTLNLPDGLKYANDLEYNWNHNPINNTQAIRYAYANINSPDGNAGDGLDIRRNNSYGWQISKNGLNYLYVRGRETSTWGNWQEIITDNRLKTINGISLVGSNNINTTQYLNPYIQNTDTVGFYLTVAQDTVIFQGTTNNTGEATTVGDTPTIDMTLTGTQITANVVDGSITPAKLSQTYLTSEVDGSIINELQTLSIAGNQLSISSGNTVTLPSGGAGGDWAVLTRTDSDAILTDPTTTYNVVFNSASDNNGSVNTSGNGITISSSGTYEIEYRVSLDPTLNTTFNLKLNSTVSGDIANSTLTHYTASAKYCHISGSYIRTVNTNETITLKLTSTTNMFGTTLQYPYLSIKKIN